VWQNDLAGKIALQILASFKKTLIKTYQPKNLKNSNFLNLFNDS